MSGVTMAVADLFGERESGEQVNCVVSSMHQACPLYAQLLTCRCGAANRRFGPEMEVNTWETCDASHYLGYVPVTLPTFHLWLGL